MSSIQKWGSWELEDVKAEAASAKGGDKAAFMNFQSGRNVVRFLPPLVGVKNPFFRYKQHYINNGEKKASFRCPRDIGKYCPACVHAEKLRRTGNPADFKAAGDYIARDRVLAHCVNRADPAAGVQIVGFGRSVYTQLLDLRMDQDTGVDYIHPMTGHDVIVVKEGTGFKTEYKVKLMPQPSQLGNLDWIDQQVDLERFAKVLSAEEIDALLNNEEGGVIDVTPAKTLPSAGPRKTASVADEFDADVPF